MKGVKGISTQMNHGTTRTPDMMHTHTNQVQ